MRKLFCLLAITAFSCASACFAQQAQSSDVSHTEHIVQENVWLVQGLGPGYWATCTNGGLTTTCSGLTLYLKPGTIWCQGTIRTYAGGTLAMTNSTTNYVYLDPTSNCAPAVSTSTFTATQVPIAVVVTSGGVITSITDDRSWITDLSSLQLSDGTLLATKAGVQQESYICANDTGSSNAYAISVSPAPTVGTYSEFCFKAANANTGASTLAVNGAGAVAIKRKDGTALQSGDISSGAIVTVKYDGTNYQCGSCGSSGASGTGIKVDTSAISGSNANFSDSTPAAASNNVNVTWQKDSGTPDTNISAQVAAATNSALGVIKSATCSPHNWISSITSGTGAIGCSQPAFSDLTGTISTAQQGGTAGGDLSGTYPNPTVADVNGVSYPASPSTNTVPVVTVTNVITYEPVPNAALAHASVTVNGTVCMLGSSCSPTGSGTGGGTSGTSPNAIPVTQAIANVGLVGWWSADCTDLSDGSTCAVPADGTTIDIWADRSGWGGNAWSASGAGTGCVFHTNQINSQPALTFNASCHYGIQDVIVGLGWNGGITIFAVGKAANTTGNYAFVSGAGNAVAYRIPGTAKGKEQQFAASNVVDLGNGTAAVDTSWHQFNVTCAISTLFSGSVNPFFRLDRASDATLNPSSCGNLHLTLPINTIGFNTGAGGDAFNGQIAEIIIYNRVLSSSEITTVESYLHTKYGL